jgi:hypothetical protein
MAAEQTGTPTLTQVNHEFAAARASRLDSAINQALQAKLPPAPKGKGTASSAASRPGTAPPSTSAASPAPKTPASPAPASAPPSSSAGAAGSTVTGGLNAALPGEPGSDTPEPASADPEQAALALEAEPSENAEGGDGEPQGEAAEAEQWTPDREAVSAAATKKDLRALEKALGLDEGVLGATNGEYAALRRRQGEVEKGETALEGNKQQLIRVFGPVVNLVQQAKGGDLMAYARSIEVSTGIPIQVFVEHWAKNIHRLDTSRLPPLLQQPQQPAQLEQQPAPAVTPEAATVKANTYLSGELKDHPALKLKGGLDDVRAAWLRGFDKATKTFKVSPQKAAEQVIADRRTAHEQEQWILTGKKPTAKTTPRTKTLSRTGASESQPREQRQLSREELIERGAAEMRRAKVVDASRRR